MSKEKLTVHKMPIEDCWKDMARIPRGYRKDVTGSTIGKAEICNVTIGNKHKLLTVRPCKEGVSDASIFIDFPTRVDLGVELGVTYEVEVRRVRWLGYWRWAWNASDPSYRIPLQIRLVSLILGFIGLFLGALSIWPVIYSWVNSK